MNRNVLLVEPNYKNKYPPIGLMKIATYHRLLGDNVVFFKGEFKDFVISQATNSCIDKFFKIDDTINWRGKYFEIYDFINKRGASLVEAIGLQDSAYEILLLNALEYYKDYYWRKGYLQDPIWDRIYITSLFTFYWDITVDTINAFKVLCKKEDDVWVGGVLATLLTNDLKKACKLKNIHKGLLDSSGIFDKNKHIVDELPLDYSILEEIDYKYPENNAYYGYMTRGCIRKCPFCAVPHLEPEFNEKVPLGNKLKNVNKKYGEKRNLLLLDNNVLASDCFDQIIAEITKNGFNRDSKYIEPDQLSISITNLELGINDKAYIRKSVHIYNEILDKLHGSQRQEFYNLLYEKKLLKPETAFKEDVLEVAEFLTPLYEKLRNKVPKQRYVDFNQGVDARLLTREKAELLSRIPIRPLRIAFDSYSQEKVYVKAIKLSKEYGITRFSNYLLYNYKDSPIDLYRRLKINVDLCESEEIDIYSFPMKYHPIFGDNKLNRDYIGVSWNRKFIRAVQTILNATKGKIGRGKSFFYKAFGHDEEEFYKLMYMPETYILYRFFFEKEGYTEEWWNCFNNLRGRDMEKAKIIIETNEFSNVSNLTSSMKIQKLLNYYTVSRHDIMDPKSELYQLKQKFDKLSTAEKFLDIII